eukprot:349532_1
MQTETELEKHQTNSQIDGDRLPTNNDQNEEVKINYDNHQHNHSDRVQRKYDPFIICPISIRLNSKYASCKSNGQIKCDGDAAETQSEWFLSIPCLNNKIRLKSLETNKWISIHDTYNNLQSETFVNNSFDEPCVIAEFAVLQSDENKDDHENSYKLKYDTVKYLSLSSSDILTISEKSERFEINVVDTYDTSKPYNVTLMHCESLRFVGVGPKYAICDQKECSYTGNAFKAIPRTQNKIALKSVIFDKYLKIPKHPIEILFSQSITKSEEFQVIKNKQNDKYLLKSFDNKYLSVDRKPSSLKRKGKNFSFHALNCNVSGNKLSEYEEWYIKPIPYLRWYSSVWITYFGNIDTPNQSFRTCTEFWINRELTNNELKSYMKDERNFEPEFTIRIAPHCTQEIIKIEKTTRANNKTFFVEWNNILNCYMVRWCLKLVADFIEPLDLDNFPFDVQHFEMPIVFRTDMRTIDKDSNGKDIKRELLWMKDYSEYMFFADQAIFGWKVCGIELRTKGDFNAVSGGVYYHFYDVILQREWAYYVWKISFILCIVSLLTLCVFTFDHETGNDRLGFVGSMFLTAIAYLFIINNHLPPSKWNTLLDFYVYFVVLFMFIIGVECSVLNMYDIDVIEDHKE